MTTSIKVAEAAKVIENAQRDINIAFVNESKIFNLMKLIHDVLSAASLNGILLIISLISWRSLYWC